MISEIGVDIVAVERFLHYSEKTDVHLSKLFTSDELDYCFKKKDPSNSLAGKFAAKEAVIKILANQGVGISHSKDIEILNDENGKPFVNSCPFEKVIDKIKISVSHDGGFAIAIALME